MRNPSKKYFGGNRVNQKDYLDLLSELRVHCVAIHDVESASDCDSIMNKLKKIPKSHHENFLEHIVERIIPKSNVVYQLANGEWNCELLYKPRQYSELADVTRHSKKQTTLTRIGQ